MMAAYGQVVMVTTIFCDKFGVEYKLSVVGGCRRKNMLLWLKVWSVFLNSNFTFCYACGIENKVYSKLILSKNYAYVVKKSRKATENIL